MEDINIHSDALMMRLSCDVAKIGHRHDCYWYTEWHDMGATIPQCSIAPMGSCPCRGCDGFLNKDEAHDVVMKYYIEKKNRKGV